MPGTSFAAPQVPFASLVTNACRLHGQNRAPVRVRVPGSFPKLPWPGFLHEAPSHG